MNLFLNAKTGSFSEVSSSQEEDVGMRKNRRKVVLRIKTRNHMEKVSNRKRLNYPNVVEKLTLKM